MCGDIGNSMYLSYRALEPDTLDIRSGSDFTNLLGKFTSMGWIFLLVGKMSQQCGKCARI